MKQGKGVGINDLVSGIFYSFEEGLYLFSTETLDLFVNIRFCEMFGETCDLQFEVNRLILLPNQVADRIIINHRDLLVTVGDDEIFREVRKADGNTVSLFIKRSVYKNNGNTFYLGVVRDVSDYLSLEKSREEATRIFHHDVRNYIGNIQNLLELLGEQVDKEHDELVRIVQSTGDKLLKIIETFIENYRLEERSFIIERSRTNILQTIEELIVRFSPVARHKDIVFEVNPERKDLDYWFLFCDSLLVDRMLSNLFGNALEASPPKGRIDISLQKHEHNIVLVIKNTGAVPEHIRARFFDKYATGGEKGLGLGAYGAKIIARAHGGNIWMSTHDVENKTEITIHLPML